MIFYVVKRLVIVLLLLVGISFLTFWLMHATPGNFFDALKLNPQISQETITRYEKLYGLDQPFLVQYGHWLWNACRGEFGYSFYYNVPVSHLIGGRLGNTFILSFASLVLTWILAIPLGIWAALNHNRIGDKLLSLLSFAAFSTPSFFLAMLLLYMVSQWGILPLGGMHSADYEGLSWMGKGLDLAKHLVIPTIVLSLGSIASLQRIMRGNMLSVLRQQYITAARAKGLPENRIIYHHALKNAFNPLVTLLGYELSGLLSGAALIEIICSWPGLGSLMLTAVRSKDVYVVMANLLLVSALLLIGNLLADIALARLDPRIRYAKT
ncbi:MAG: ABC transporter permease [Candidatus Omnitrophica bacterium]|nr:ABC transporter permease [Candidatus Omnitrophota bacterium]